MCEKTKKEYKKTNLKSKKSKNKMILDDWIHLMSRTDKFLSRQDG